MFCPKCGSPVADDAAFCTTCGAKLNAASAEASATQNTPAANAGNKTITLPDAVSLDLIQNIGFNAKTIMKLAAPVLVLLSFILHFINWYHFSVSESFLGSTLSLSDFFGPYGGPTVSMLGASQTASLSDINGWFVFAKVLVIINIVVFAIYVATLFVNVGKLVPALAKINFNLYAKLAYFGILALALIVGLIACIAEDTICPAFAWYLNLFFDLVGLVVVIKPSLVKLLLDKVNIK